MKPSCHVALLAVIFAPGVFAQPDVKALIRESIANYDKAWRAGMQWGYTQQDVTCSDGKTDTAISEIMPLEGTPYERVVRKNGKPLDTDEQRKEDEKYQKALRDRRKESPEEHRARIEKYEKERGFLKDLPNAYDFKLVGEQVVDGRSAWMVTLTPRPDFVPTTPHGDLLKHIQGKLWIDKQDLQWARAEAHVIDTISIGLILARIGPGAKITLDMDPVSHGLWMPHEITINGVAKVLLVHNKNLDERLTFTGYHSSPGGGPGAVEVAEKIAPGTKAFR